MIEIKISERISVNKGMGDSHIILVFSEQKEYIKEFEYKLSREEANSIIKAMQIYE